MDRIGLGIALDHVQLTTGTGGAIDVHFSNCVPNRPHIAQADAQAGRRVDVGEVANGDIGHTAIHTGAVVKRALQLLGKAKAVLLFGGQSEGMFGQI